MNGRLQECVISAILPTETCEEDITLCNIDISSNCKQFKGCTVRKKELVKVGNTFGYQDRINHGQVRQIFNIHYLQ